MILNMEIDVLALVDLMGTVKNRIGKLTLK